MASRFPGFPTQGIQFLQELKDNNTREWFTPRKAVFDEQVKAPMVALVDAVNGELASFAPDYLTEPSKAIYRIYRDTRFSNDKTPYKTHIAGNLHKQGTDKHAAAGYYFSIGADQIEIAAGVYMPGPQELLRLRQHISANFEEFSKLAQDKTVTKLVGPLQGDSLARPPKGFAVNDPAIDWIKKKQWYYYKTDLDLGLAVTPKLLPELVKRLRAMTPMVDFFNRGLAPKINTRDFFF
ncbi:MAG TPA: DUF2461 domain-containing protein [Bryobacteraceae bacterium]|nr:DUF2461 domain-containing protein [Bryobacteraceae bacterium]